MIWGNQLRFSDELQFRIQLYDKWIYVKRGSENVL